MSEHSVSVIVAAHNRGERMGRTLDSIAAQTLAPSEIIIVDDGSTDDTASWIRSNYPAVSVRTFPNGGTSVARNRGAAEASGDVLVFLDHDDALQPHAIETLISLLHRFPEARAAYADHTLRNVMTGECFANHHSLVPAFHRLRHIQPLRTEAGDRLYGTGMHRALLMGNLLQQPWAIFRSAYAAVGGFDGEIRYCEDWDLYLRVSGRFPVAVTDTVISDHYIEGQNLHRVSGQEEQHMKVLQKHIAATSLMNLPVHAVLRKRLAQYYKGAGDRHRLASTRIALHEYFTALRLWPFDAVVAARCIGWTASVVANAVFARGREQA